MNPNREKKVTGFLRASIAGIVIILQFVMIYFIVRYLRSSAAYVYYVIQAFSIIALVALVSQNRNTSYIIAWTLIITLLPVFGYILYILWGSGATSSNLQKHIHESLARGFKYLNQDAEIMESLRKKHPDRKRYSEYLKHMGFPVYRNTSCRYFSIGEEQFRQMLADLRRAEKFIFMEYFILDTGELWDELHSILREKAAAGVEVRLMYDDFGSIITAPDKLLTTLGEEGIAVERFNPVHRYISRLYINYRNHQKITVIDGSVAYTGGTNIADEYINLYPKLGHWKDTSIRLEGDAVWSLTVNFLAMWDSQTNALSELERYKPSISIKSENQGFVQPFADGPANNPDNPAEITYRSIISGARDYVYITTPYLVIDYAMTETLCAAAKGGVDVRIITPRQWDHWYVHYVTRSNYRELIEAGVKVYEYTPGFIHAKMIISDGDNGVVGSINMDYRSFHLHFENGVWLCGDPVINDIHADFLDTIKNCQEITMAELKKIPLAKRIVGRVLRVFAVLL